MTKFTIVRHGETEWNVAKRLQGWLDSPLTERGKEQTLLLREELRDVVWDVAFVSSSGRAVATAELLLSGRHVDTLFEDDLREIYLGQWQGKYMDELLSSSERDAYLAYKQTPHLYEAVHTESLTQLTKRVMGVLQKAALAYPDSYVLVVTHGVVVTSIVHYVLQRELVDFWSGEDIAGTSVTELWIEDGRWTLGKVGCTEHLHKRNATS